MSASTSSQGLGSKQVVRPFVSTRIVRDSRSAAGLVESDEGNLDRVEVAADPLELEVDRGVVGVGFHRSSA
jgi:hypothetical protein